MLRSRGRPRAAGPGRRRARPGPAVTAAAAWALAAALGTAGCAASASAGQTPAVQAATAYVPMPVTPGLTAGYVVIRNYASRADSLISARTSAGGRVTFRVPAGGGSRSVPAIALPAGTTVRLVPDGPHLLITGLRHVQNGKVITLTLIFRHASPVQVPALVTDPSQTGPNSNYFMN
jgi:copper(I)-binding protein